MTLFSGTDLVVDATLNTKVTSATHNFVAADVGTRLFISAGTGWTIGYYTISSVAANAATLSSSPAAVGTTGGTWAEVGVDYSQQNAPQVAIGGGTVTTSITTNVITFTGGTYTPSNKDVGNYVQMISGTNVTANSFFRVSSVGATTWTMDANVVSAGTTTNAVGNMGGALLTLATLATRMIAQNKAFLTGAFSSAGVTFAQTVTPSGANPASRLIGYGSTRGDSTHATLTLTGGAGQTALNFTGAGWQLYQIDVDCAGLGTSSGIVMSTSASVRNCKIANYTTRGINLTGGSVNSAQDCEVTGGTGSGGGIATSGVTHIIRCFIHDNAGTGINCNVGTNIHHCLIVNNSGGASDGIITSSVAVIMNNTIHNNGRHGVNSTGTNYVGNLIRNNIFTNNGGFGLVANATAAAPAMPDMDGNVYGGGASANTSGTRSFADSLAGVNATDRYVNVRDVILTGSPYVGPTTGTTANFALNNVADAGAACRGSGAPQTWPGNTGSTGYPDMGVVQTRAGGAVGIITST